METHVGFQEHENMKLDGEDNFQEHGIVKIIFRDDDHDEILNESNKNDQSKFKKVLRSPIKKTHQCKFCHKVFKHHPSLARHVKLHHSKIKAKKVKRSCDKCGKIFMNGRDLKKHVDIHHLGLAEKYKQKCHICLKNVQQLKTHIRFIHKGQQHLSEYNGRCPQCLKTFSNDYGVKRHIKAVHLQVKPWECGECGKRFNDKKDLVRHHRGVHLGERVNTWNKQDSGIHKTNHRNTEGFHPKVNNLVQDTLTKSDGFATSEIGTEVQELPRDVLAQDVLVADQAMILDSCVVPDTHNKDNRPRNSHGSVNIIFDKDGVQQDGQSHIDSVVNDSKIGMIRKSKILQVEENRFELIEERICENGDVVLEIQEIDQENDDKSIKIIEGRTKTLEESSNESEKLKDNNYVTLKWTSNSKEKPNNVKSNLKKIYSEGLTGMNKDNSNKYETINQSSKEESETQHNETLEVNLKIADIIKDPDGDLGEELTEDDFSAVGSMLHEGSEIDILPMLSKGSAETAFKHHSSLQTSSDSVSEDIAREQKHKLDTNTINTSIQQKDKNDQKMRSILGEMEKNESHKTDARTRRIAYRCGACGKMFVGEEFLKTHIERIHVKNKEINNCSDGKSINRNEDEMEEEFGDLEVFFRKEEAENIKQNKAQIKPVSILKEENSNKDVKNKMDDLENIICDKDGCQKSFSGRSRRILYKKHMERVHLQLKEEVCPQCNKGFYEKRDLMRHIESHHENIRTICPVESCGKLVARLDQHVRISHSDSKQKERIECPKCGKPFGRIYDLTRHEESVHQKIKNFICSICEKGFTDKRDLNRHSQAIHLGVKKGQKNFPCCFCGMTFKRKKDLDNHRMEHMEEEEEFEMEHVQGVNYLEVNPSSTIYVSNEGDTVVETETEMIEVHEMETNIAVVETNGEVHMLKQGEDGLVVLPKFVEYVTADSQYVIE